MWFRLGGTQLLTVVVPRVLAGVLCGVCNTTDGYAKQGRSCVKCWPHWANVAAVGAMLVVVCLALIRIAAFHEFKRASSMKIVVRIAINYISILASLGTFRAKVLGWWWRMILCRLRLTACSALF